MSNASFENDGARLSDAECLELFRSLFPGGLHDQALLSELAPQGWAASPLRLAFHPSEQTLEEEHRQMSVNLESLTKSFPEKTTAPRQDEQGQQRLDELFAKTQKQVEEQAEDEPESDVSECARLVGLCLWDIFSENHEAIARDGRVADIGSFRGAAGFIAEFFHGDGKEHKSAELAPGFSVCMDYADFYMGTRMIADRTDLRPIYRLIFARLKAQGFTWKYSFPQLFVVDVAPLKQQLDDEERRKSGKPEWAGYDPSAAFAKEREEQERQAEHAKMQEQLDRGHSEALEAARKHPPPSTVEVYREIFGRWPEGWPPWE